MVDSPEIEDGTHDGTFGRNLPEIGAPGWKPWRNWCSGMFPLITWKICGLLNKKGDLIIISEHWDSNGRIRL